MADLTVIYEAGVLRPTDPLTFREGQRIKIRILEIHPPDLSLAEALAPLIASNALDSNALIEAVMDQPNSNNSN